MTTFYSNADTVENVIQSGAAGAGFLPAIVSSTVKCEGYKRTTEIVIDFAKAYAAGTPIKSEAADGEILGTEVLVVSHIGKITAAVNGYITYIQMICVEAPVGAQADMSLQGANDGDGYLGMHYLALSNDNALFYNSRVWTAGLYNDVSWTHGTAKTQDFSGSPAGRWMYLANGAAGSDATYTAGKFILTLIGYVPPG